MFEHFLVVVVLGIQHDEGPWPEQVSVSPVRHHWIRWRLDLQQLSCHEADTFVPMLSHDYSRSWLLAIAVIRISNLSPSNCRGRLWLGFLGSRLAVLLVGANNHHHGLAASCHDHLGCWSLSPQALLGRYLLDLYLLLSERYNFITSLSGVMIRTPKLGSFSRL